MATHGLIKGGSLTFLLPCLKQSDQRLKKWKTRFQIYKDVASFVVVVVDTNFRNHHDHDPCFEIR